MAETTGKRIDQMATGLIIVATGLAFLLDRVGVFSIENVWRLWPVTLIILGFVQIVSARRGGSFGWGLILFLEGGLFLAVQYNWGGFNWSNFWPVLIMIVGIGLVADVLVAGRRRPLSGGGESR